MALDKLVRTILPGKVRSIIGTRLLRAVTDHSRILPIYLKVIHGHSLPLTVRGNTASYVYLGRTIECPKDGIGSFLEVFQESVYDSIHTPQEGDIVVDIGAYVGMWSVRAALSGGTVIAVEPDPTNRLFLSNNTDGLPITILPWAVSNHNGLETLYLSSTSSCHSSVIKSDRKMEIECRTVDTIAEKCGKKIDFLKIDAEGAELKVLQGAEETLKGRIRLSIASYRSVPDGHPETGVLVKFLEDRGLTVETNSGLRRYIYAAKNK